MTAKPILCIGVLLALGLSACQAGADNQAEIEAHTDRLVAIENQLEEVADSLSAMQSEMAMQEELSLESEHGAAPAASPFDLAVAQYFMDTAGFHAMAEALAEEGAVIDPSYLSSVNRVSRVLSNTSWPESLQAEADSFIGQLTEFTASLESDDAVAAASLSEAIHDAQHDLSHEIDNWLGSADAEPDHEEG